MKKYDKIQALAKKQSELHQQAHSLNKEIIKELFLAIPNLKSLSLNSEQEYNDSNYYTRIALNSINGKDFKIEVSYPDQLFDDGDELPDWVKSLLMSLEMKEKDLNLILDTILDTVDRSYFENDEEYELTRSKYVKTKRKPKAKSKAKAA